MKYDIYSHDECTADQDFLERQLHLCSLVAPNRRISQRQYYPDHVPNSSKVLVILEQLDLPYETLYIELDEFKKPPLTDVNPNGRVPGISDAQGLSIWNKCCEQLILAIIDPNTGLTLWESGATIQVKL